MAQGPIDNPYAGPGVPPMGGSADAAGRVAGPAIALMVVGGINILLALWTAIVSGVLQLGAPPPELPPNVDPNAMEMVKTIQQVGPAMNIVIGLVGLACAALIIFGAVRMKSLQGYGLAVTSSVVAMIPFLSCCCLAGLPIGIWSIVVLMNQDVKSAFH